MAPWCSSALRAGLCRRRSQRFNAGGPPDLTRPTMGPLTLRMPPNAGGVRPKFSQPPPTAPSQVRFGARYPLSEAAQAHRDLEGRRTTGRLVL